VGLDITVDFLGFVHVIKTHQNILGYEGNLLLRERLFGHHHDVVDATKSAILKQYLMGQDWSDTTSRQVETQKKKTAFQKQI
jgi:hypothetical protein